MLNFFFSRISNCLGNSIVLIFSILISCCLLTIPTKVIAASNDYSPQISNLVNQFSEAYCSSILEVKDSEKAVKVAIRSMIRDLVFSGDLKQIMLLPKEEMAEFVSGSIFGICGDSINNSRQELTAYFVELSDSAQTRPTPKPFKPFN
ncbi:hypothetical protein [Prochlorococcus sp. MIT 1341]|uniref:hypothetical protein n=1 Tax=Prochlorococcus sp. MIT 1341 TaxID=3096221 RepID=UPI002A74DC6B|nr:hypothetical protein [Prochlorococcus sp. MIT 1341]